MGTHQPPPHTARHHQHHHRRSRRRTASGSGPVSATPSRTTRSWRYLPSVLEDSADRVAGQISLAKGLNRSNGPFGRASANGAALCGPLGAAVAGGDRGGAQRRAVINNKLRRAGQRPMTGRSARATWPLPSGPTRGGPMYLTDDQGARRTTTRVEEEGRWQRRRRSTETPAHYHAQQLHHQANAPPKRRRRSADEKATATAVNRSRRSAAATPTASATPKRRPLLVTNETASTAAAFRHGRAAPLSSQKQSSKQSCRTHPPPPPHALSTHFCLSAKSESTTQTQHKEARKRGWGPEVVGAVAPPLGSRFA